MSDIDYTRATNTGLLTATGAETVYDTTVAIDYSIGGKAYRKATVADGTTPTTDGDGAALSTLAASKGCVMVWCLNAAGTVSVFQSDVNDLDASDAFEVVPNFPVVDLDTYCPFAYQVITNGSTGSTFTFGSSNWNATGITVAIQNVLTLPRRPQES